MKWIKYNFVSAKVNHGPEDAPMWEDIIITKEVGWNEVNEKFAKTEAIGGHYSIEDDGRDDIPLPMATEQRLALLESAVKDIPNLIAAAIKSAMSSWH